MESQKIDEICSQLRALQDQTEKLNKKVDDTSFSGRKANDDVDELRTLALALEKRVAKLEDIVLKHIPVSTGSSESALKQSILGTIAADPNRKGSVVAGPRDITGIGRPDGPAEERATFLRDCWVPFVKELRHELICAQERRLHEYSEEERLPSQKRIRELLQRNLDLTEQWYGRGNTNVSLIYEWFIAINNAAGLLGYCWSEVPQRRSIDGYTLAVDGDTRRSLYKPSSPRPDYDGIVQSTGSSAIDNTVLPNTMTPEESRMLLAGGLIKQVFLNAIQKKQKAILKALSEYTQSAWDKLTPGDLRKRLENLDPSIRDACRIDDTSLSFTALKQTGLVTRSWGQLDEESKKRAHDYLATQLKDKATATHETNAEPAREDQNDELAKFLAWSKSHPGEVYKNDRKLHKKMLLLGLWKKEISVVKRSAMEEHTVLRYLAVSWTRKVDLVRIDDDGETVLRPSGQEEYSRLRANAFPYGDSHGMGVSGGGVAEDGESLSYELGTALPSDPSAKLPNWYCTDIEKILNELRFLNPCSGEESVLPGEALHVVGQNPKAGSSIGATQHTQITRGFVHTWPIARLRNRPHYVPELGESYIDIVQVGDHHDAFFVKIRTTNPCHTQVVKFLHDLRLKLLRCKGHRSIDFNVCGLPHGDGWFDIIFSPISMIEKVKEPVACDRNPLTGKTSLEAEVPVSSLDYASSRGVLLVSGRVGWNQVLEGREMLSRLYDFARCPGSRSIVRDYILSTLGLTDNSGKVVGAKDVVAVADISNQRVFDVLISSASDMELEDALEKS